MRRSVKAITIAVLTGIVALASGPSWAANPRSVPIGGRTATMGGAGTAAGNDSAMPYLNPAGLAGVPGDIFAVSASVYGYTRRSVSKLFAPNGLDPEYGQVGEWQSETKADSVTDLPSSVMYFQQVDSDELYHVYGLSLVIPASLHTEIVGSYSAEFPSTVGNLSLASTLKRDETDYYFGPSYAISIDDTVRLGVSLYARYAREFFTGNFQKNLSYQDDAYAGAHIQLSQKIALSSQAYEVSFAPIAGVQVRLHNDVWAGAGVAPPSVHVFGRAFETGESNQLDYNGLFASGQQSSQTNTAWFQVQTPLRLNAGLAYDDRESFSLAADIHFYAKQSNAQQAKGTATMTQVRTGETARKFTWGASFERDILQTIDVSAGAEVVLSDLLALRGGFFTDNANTDELDVNMSSLYEVRESRVGGTLGLGLILGSFDSTFGVVYSHASGKMVTADAVSGPVAQAVVNTSSDTVLLVVSGAVTTEEAQETINNAIPVNANGGTK